MEFAEGFSPLRHLGQTASGALLGLESLVGIHMVHRLVAVVAAGALLGLAWRLGRSGQRSVRRFGLGLGLLTLLQVATGLSNVVLSWPLVAALAHTSGAAALVLLLAMLLARSGTALHAPARADALRPARAAAP